MHCKQVREWLPDFAADRLPSVLARQVEEHLAECDECWAAWERERDPATEEFSSLEGALNEPDLAHLVLESPPPLPEGWTEQLLERIEWPQPVPTRWWVKTLRHPAVSIAYAAAAVLLVFSVAQRVFLWESSTNGLGSIILQGQLWLVQINARLAEVTAWASSILTYFF